MTHLTFEEISDVADGRRPTADAHTRHLADCGACRGTLEKVRELIKAAHALPRDVAPPPEVWTALRARVGKAHAPRAASRWRYAGWMAAAATIVVMVGGLLLMSGNSQKAKGSKLATTPTVPAVPVVFHAVEQNYSGTVAELRRTLDTQRATLSPATIRVLERSLATIDTAIAEAREALASDPANQILIKILSTNYERKVELLQRATELSSSS